ncbi:hypothetical protein PR002_g26364 [Phytophthora rubi]|nr:hypothetical protein PR002_g26364 [Phytophthora rubi]
MVDEHGDQQGFKKMDPTLYLMNKKHFGVNFQPSDDQIHVLAVVPKEIAGQQHEPRDSSKEWLTEFFTKRVEFHSLPFVGRLGSYAAQSLPVKIRAKKKWLDKWNLSPELQERIFAVDDAAPCKEFKSLIFGKRALKPFHGGRTESSYHIVWDFVIRNVLDHIFSRARIDRDSDIGSSTRKKHPDFFFILNDVCVFRGEESSPDVSINVPTAELCSNLEWEYGSVPYVFGYAASGFNVDLLALHRDDDKIVTKTHIGSFNFEVTEDVFRTVLAILNLSLLFPAIVEACPASGKCQYVDITRSSGVIVRLSPTFVEKIFPDTSSFDRLKQIYGLMENAGVPNVDHLTDVRLQKKSMLFQPRGTRVEPSNLLELLGALRDVLQALVALHRLGWIHRDIRWSNVLRQREGGSWFLIDFADAATSPQPSSSGQHLSVEEHAPEIFVDDGVHTTAVDIWAVGYLIETCDVGWLDFAERSSFYERLMQEDPTARPSAEEALAVVEALGKAAKREQEANLEFQPSSRPSRTQSRKRKHSTLDESGSDSFS